VIVPSLIRAAGTMLLLVATAAPAACPPTAGLPTAAQLQAITAEARDRGVLWKITKGGRTSHLYGTIHVGKLEWAVPGPTIAAALRESEVLALEIDFTDPEIAATAAAITAAGPDAPALPPELRARLARQVEAACVASAAIAAIHPVMQAITLTTLVGRWDGLDPSYAQELSLGGAARAFGQRVVSLESVKLQMEALIPKDPEDAIELIDETIEQLEENRVRPVLKRLAAAWEKGDLATIADYESWCDCVRDDQEREFLRRVNDERNPHLAAGIDALHLNGQRVFAAVGALHMVGEKPLPKLLAARGYTVERVIFRP
jgi:uncharacterized protein